MAVENEPHEWVSFQGVGSPLGDASRVVSGTRKITASGKAKLNATIGILASTAGVVAM